MAAGGHGMVGGQMIDLIAETRPDLDIGAITRLQRLKTGALIAFSCEAGAILGKAPLELRLALCAAMRMIWALPSRSPTICSMSRAPPGETGKPVGQDAAAGKATFVSILGIERARAQASYLVRQAVAHLDLFEERADLLRQAARFVVERRA